MTEPSTIQPIAESGDPDGPVPQEPPKLAEILPPGPGEIQLHLTLTLAETGCIAASLQTCVQWRAITQPSQLNIVNSVLRKFHDAKQKYVEEHP